MALRAAGRVPAPGTAHKRLLAGVRERARITLNFHPDRLLADGRTVAESLAADGRYRSQYETGLSNGSRTAYPGGPRDEWEFHLFGGAYRTATGAERPKYGALNVLNHPDGAAPRFGSCYVRLRAEVHARATYCHPDSHFGPEDVGTIDVFGPVLAAWLATGGTISPFPPPVPVQGRALDTYIEAQVHGDIDLARDAEALVLDPSFRGTKTAQLLANTGVPVEWHAGFALAPEEVDAEFRGPVMVPLAARVCRSYAREGILSAEVLGHAAASVVGEPEAWAEWGSQDEVLQYVKQLWHVLVRYGRGLGDV
ncbi:DUF3626 domain-containing protein [Streptomyces sp. ISL-100]|uniref:DUF3626 domain-containing protein n=1 Tax=Streptomyces sp. ISL-100 TaxID=2819173 RepID=UPI002035DC24|nr:DUF3626 domain-containing protein [Streptomyces sp. ISL-100]